MVNPRIGQKTNAMKHQNIALIIRGVSGCGKTTLAETLKAIVGSEKTTICTADDYFCQDGEYKFDPKLLGKAHSYCFRKFCDAIRQGKSLVIQNNTNAKEKDFQEYYNYAVNAGYKVFVVVIENRHNGTNVHGVPGEALQRQHDALASSIRLRA